MKEEAKGRGWSMHVQQHGRDEMQWGKVGLGQADKVGLGGLQASH